MNLRELRFQLPLFQGIILGLPLLVLSFFLFFQWSKDRDNRELEKLQAGKTAVTQLIEKLTQELSGDLKVLRDDPSLLKRADSFDNFASLWTFDPIQGWACLLPWDKNSIQIPKTPYQFTSKGLLIWDSLPLNSEGKTLVGSRALTQEAFFLWKKILHLDFVFSSRITGLFGFSTLTDPYGSPLSGPNPFQKSFLTKAEYIPAVGNSPAFLLTPLSNSPEWVFGVLDTSPQSGDLQYISALMIIMVTWFAAASLGLFLLVKMLLHPIQTLKEGIERIVRDYKSGEKNFKPLGVNSKNELGAAAAAFNQVGLELFTMLTRMNTLNQALMESNRLKDEILSNTSHELRTPLNGILNATDLLKAENLTPLQKEHLGLIFDAGSRLLVTVDALLDYSEALNTKVTEVLEHFSFHSLVGPLWETILPLSRKKNIRLFFNLPPLPMVVGNQEKIKKALAQILDNAFKFTTKGFVSLTAELADQDVIIQIVDTGQGISPGVVNNIFDPFTQGVSGLNRPFGGLGLGLSLAKELIEQCGGSIHIQSKEGSGTIVTITLKSFDSALDPELHQSNINPKEDLQELKKLDPTGYGSSVSILVVDDEPSNLYLITRLIQQMGFDAFAVDSGAKALQRLASGLTPTVILLDIMMPVMDGLEVCREIRKKFSLHELPIILFSAKSQPGDIIQGLEAGANDYLIKPLNREELQARLKPHVALKKTNDLFRNFLPRDFIEILHSQNWLNTRLGDSMDTTLTFLVFKISEFQELAQTMSPQDSINFLNSFYTRVGPIIRENGGFILRYSSDGFLGVFQEEPDKALISGLLILQALETYNTQRVGWNLKKLTGGIGVHRGKTHLGLVGEENYLEPVFVSQTYGITHHLAKLTQGFGTPILCSGNTLEVIHDRRRFLFRYMGMVKEGLMEPIYEVLPLPLPQLMTKVESYQDVFERAVFFVEIGSFSEAKRLLEPLVTAHPGDQPLHLLYTKTLQGEHNFLPEL